VLVNAADDADQLRQWVTRRVAGEPLEHIVGWVEFGECRVNVAPGVFVPRQRSRLLATLAVDAAARRREPLVVELCCGAGAIAQTIATRLPAAKVFASDVDERAVACARTNLEPLDATVVHGDLYAGLPRDLLGRVDVLAANAPYVPSAELSYLPSEARDHEPRTALDGGLDGLAVLRRVIEQTDAWLASDGVLLVECSAAQAQRTVASMEQQGLSATVLHDDDLGATVVRAEWSRPPRYDGHRPGSASTTTCHA
jgi:release factor glutamine methyltransferase